MALETINCLQQRAKTRKTRPKISSFGVQKPEVMRLALSLQVLGEHLGARSVSRGPLFGPVLEPCGPFGHQFRLAGASFAIFWLPFGVHVDGLLCFFW